MTVSQLRERMTEKVVPEKVMPQNIIAYLMDEDAEIPELDAFTFLNRLRGLGIGSADFLYLLKGCNAPEEAIAKIESNPAMNLNSLILTLDGSGLTSQDYTRMLYTARQLWERTLTMRILNEDAPEPDVKQYVPRAKIAESYPAPAEEILPAEKILPAEENTEEPAEQSVPEQETEAEEAAPPEDYPEEDNQAEEQPADMYSVDSIIAELTGGKGNTQAPAQENAEPENEPAKSEEFREETAEEEPQGEASEETELNITARVFTETSQLEKLSESELESENGGQDGEDAEPDEEPTKRESGGYSKGALITSAAGAAVVVAVGAVIGALGFAPAEKQDKLRCAADAAEIFGEIYRSYNNGAVGGENIVTALSPETELFGGKLVNKPEGLGIYSVDGEIYFCGSGAVSVWGKGELSAPEGTEFISVFEQDGALFAVFTGSESGFMRIEDGSEVYVSAQDGELCDIVIEDGAVKLGTAYVPDYKESFFASQTEFYLPTAGGALISPEQVLLSGEDGCGYALSASYSLSDGSVQSVGAVLGNPIFASADGAYACIKSAEGCELILRGEEPTSVSTSAVSAAAAGSGVYADYSPQEGMLYIRGADGTALSALNNFPKQPQKLLFAGNTLVVFGEDGVILAADCTTPAQPVIIEQEPLYGAARGDYLLTVEDDDVGFRLTLWQNIDGAAQESSAYTKTLTAAEKKTLEFGGMDMFYVGEGCAGAAYRYFDGVSVISEFVLFGKKHQVVTLYDDPTGITAISELDGKICIFHNGAPEPVG